MSLPVPAVTFPKIEIAGSVERFPARRIYCVGRNYMAHIREIGSDEREPPFFFQKPTDALVLDGGDFPYPPHSTDVHYEIELVVTIGKAGRNIAPGDALDHVFGYAVGLDMTRRDLQGVAKEMRRPWEAGKAFDHAAPYSAIVPATDIGHPEKGALWLKVNGETRQEGDLSHQIWSVPESIAHLSALFELAPGDLIFTGTPSGVGPVTPGSVMEGHIDGVGDLKVRVV